MAETALIFPIPEAEPYVRDLRDRYDPAAADGVPAHITVLPPYAGRFDAIVPHLTVAHGAEENLLEAERQFRSAHPVLDFRCRCDSLALIEKSSGRWLSNRVFRLGKQWI